LPTGYGKMLIYQLLPVAAEEIVVSMYVLTAELIDQTETPTGSLFTKGIYMFC